MSEDPEAIEQDIERTREHLAQSLDALEGKVRETTDVKAKARAAADDAKVRAKGAAGRQADAVASDPVPLAAGVGAGFLVLVLGLWWRGRR